MLRTNRLRVSSTARLDATKDRPPLAHRENLFNKAGLSPFPETPCAKLERPTIQKSGTVNLSSGIL